MFPAVLCGSASAASAEDTFRELIYDAWENKADTVSIKSLRLPVETVINWYYKLLYTDADWFYISSSFRYSTVNSFSGAYVGSLQIQYNYELDAIPEMQIAFDAAVSDILSKVQPSWSDAEKVLYLHDYLIEHCEYDLSLSNKDAYTALVTGNTVCQGYSLAMNLLCNELNIPCYPITSDSLRHMWNVIYVDGNWYHCDVTYDDAIPDRLGHGTHHYVLQSDTFMQSDSAHTASDWTYYADEQIICDSDAYSDAFWTGVIDGITPRQPIRVRSLHKAKLLQHSAAAAS